MKNFKRILSVLLCVFMLASAVAGFAGAEEAATGKTPTRVSVTVNGDTSASRGLCWYTVEQTDTKVELQGVSASEYKVENVVCEEWEGNYMHKLTVAGLKAGVTYTYRVGDGTEWSDWGTFTTDNGDDVVSFINIADVQAGDYEGFMRGANTLAAAFALMPDADFVSNCGDFTNDSTNEEWDAYDKAFAPLNKQYTLVPVSGNHDGLGVEYWFTNMFNLDTTESVQVKDGVNYSFDYGNAHFAVLNTNDLLSISNAQLNWLKNDMNSTDKDWKIVFFHKSPYTLGKDGKWPDALYLQKVLTKVLDECNVDFAFSGHDHQYLRTKPLTGNALDKNGTTYVLSGTAGGKRYEVRPFLKGHFMNTDFIDRLVIQREGVGFESADYIGGCFETIQIEGDKLFLKTYILNDETGETVLVDEYGVQKNLGENKITFTGDNTTSEMDYIKDVVPSFLGLATYAFTEWLPKFLVMLPELLYSVIEYDVF